MLEIYERTAKELLNYLADLTERTFVTRKGDLIAKLDGGDIILRAADCRIKDNLVFTFDDSGSLKERSNIFSKDEEKIIEIFISYATVTKSASKNVLVRSIKESTKIIKELSSIKERLEEKTRQERSLFVLKESNDIFALKDDSEAFSIYGRTGEYVKGVINVSNNRKPIYFKKMSLSDLATYDIANLQYLDEILKDVIDFKIKEPEEESLCH